MNISCDCQPSRPSPRKLCCPKGVEINYVEIPASMGTSDPGQPFAPENGAYKNTVVKYAADGNVFIYTSEGIPVRLGAGGGSGRVISVNGKTGEVVLTTSDLENTSDYQTGDEVVSAIQSAISQLDIPTNVSELVNDAGYQNAQQVATAVAGEATLRETADNNLQTQIDAISASSDVTDIVGTYAELQAYDTSTLGDKDIIKVLQDESRNDETTYYRWSTTTQTFTLIGEEGPYYTKSQADGRFVAQTTYTTDKAALEAAIGTKQDELTEGNNIQISGSVISATDTTYSDFTGTDGTTAGTAGLVPAPATTDADKFLKSDGTWGTLPAGELPLLDAKDFTDDKIQVDDLDPGVYRITYTGSGNFGRVYNGTGRLLNYVTENQEAILVVADDRYNSPHKIAMAFSDEAGNNFPTKWLWVNSYNQTSTNGRTQVVFDANDTSVRLGQSSSAASGAIAVGAYAEARDTYSTAIGGGNSTSSGRRAYATNQSVAVGAAYAQGYLSVAIGTGAKATTQGEVNMGTGDYSTTGGYNGTPYRLIRGIHPGEQDHDVVVLGQMNTRILAGGTAAPTTSTIGSVGALYAYVESGTGHLAICTAADASTSTYTWQTLV